MWCLYPFLEVNAHDEELYSFAFQHYYKELTNVLETFGNTLGDHQLPENLADFRSLIRRGFVLEFLIVTVLRPVMSITNPEVFLNWHKKLLKHEKRKAKGGLSQIFAGQKPKLPEQDQVFQNPRYLEFLQFYFKIATSLGAFQELGLVYFELMKDAMFGEGKLDGFESDLPPKKPKTFSQEWFTSNFFCSCIQAQSENSFPKSKEAIKTEKTIMPREDMIYADEEEIVKELQGDTTDLSTNIPTKLESIYEPVRQDPDQKVEMTVCIPPPEEPRPPTPDPLRTLAAQLHASFVDYKETFEGFKDLLERNADVPMTEEEDEAASELFENNVFVPRTPKDSEIILEELYHSKPMPACNFTHEEDTFSKNEVKTSSGVEKTSSHINLGEGAHACMDDKAKQQMVKTFFETSKAKKTPLKGMHVDISENVRLESEQTNFQVAKEDEKLIEHHDLPLPSPSVKSRKDKVHEVVNPFSYNREAKSLDNSFSENVQSQTEPCSENAQRNVLIKAKDDCAQTNVSHLKETQHSCSSKGSFLNQRSTRSIVPTVENLDHQSQYVGTPKGNVQHFTEAQSNSATQGDVPHSTECQLKDLNWQKNTQETETLEYRKDSFCSDVSRQDLIDILDQDEASWGDRVEATNVESITDTKLTEKETLCEIAVIKEYSDYDITKPNLNKSSDCPESIYHSHSNETAICSDKQSIMAWLQLAQPNKSILIGQMKEETEESPCAPSLEGTAKSLFELNCDSELEEAGPMTNLEGDHEESCKETNGSAGKFFPLGDLDSKYKPFGEVTHRKDILLEDKLYDEIDIFPTALQQDSIKCALEVDISSCMISPHFNETIPTNYTNKSHIINEQKRTHSDHSQSTTEKSSSLYQTEELSSLPCKDSEDELPPSQNKFTNIPINLNNRVNNACTKYSSNHTTDIRPQTLSKQKQNSVSFKIPDLDDSNIGLGNVKKQPEKILECIAANNDEAYTGEGNPLIPVQIQGQLSSSSSQACEDIQCELFYVCTCKLVRERSFIN